MAVTTSFRASIPYHTGASDTLSRMATRVGEFKKEFGRVGKSNSAISSCHAFRAPNWRDVASTGHASCTS